MDGQYTQPETHYEFLLEDRRHATIGTKREAFSYMDQIFDGWCTHQKASVLIDIILAYKPKKIVEIGVWGGKSLVPMAFVLKNIGKGGIAYGIDPWDNGASVEGITHEGSKEFWTVVDHEDIMHKLIRYIHAFGLEQNIELIRATSADAPLIDEIDLLHVDGNHSEEASYFDVTKWVPQVRSGGWIVFDDMNWSENGKVTTRKAVEYLNQHCHKIAEINDICLWGIWYKP